MNARPPMLPKGKRPVLRSSLVVKTSDQPTVLNCLNCAGTCEIRDHKETKMLVCKYCGCAMDLSSPGLPQGLGQFAKSKKIDSPIDLGDRCDFSGRKFTVLGRISYVQIEEGVRYEWSEYQMRSDEGRYIFLSLENGHWTIFKKIRSVSRLPRPSDLHYQQTFRHLNQNFKVFEAGGRCSVDSVEGELSWIAKKGDRISFMTAISPPDVLTAEWSSNEFEWFHGRYQTIDQVAKAFRKDGRTFGPVVGIAPSQQFVRDRSQKLMMLCGFVACAALAVAILFTVGKRGPLVVDQQVSNQDLLSGAGAMTSSFQVGPGNQVYELTVSSSVRNGWIETSYAFVDDQDFVKAESGLVSEMYEGSDHEGYWREGNGVSSKLIRLQGPATLRINIFGDSGSSTMSSSSSENINVPLNVKLREGVLPSRYFIVAFLLSLIYPLKELAREWFFESRRWPVDEDDD